MCPKNVETEDITERSVEEGLAEKDPALRQVASVTTSKGGTYHRFERAGKPEYGRMGP